jgi:hypothetical protein
MCCIATSLVLLGPRLAGLLWWIFAPERWDRSFSSFIWPVLGLIFVPWTTLMYVIVKPGGVAGFDWIWLGLSLVADVASYSGGYRYRESVPGYPYQQPV